MTDKILISGIKVILSITIVYIARKYYLKRKIEKRIKQVG